SKSSCCFFVSISPPGGVGTQNMEQNKNVCTCSSLVLTRRQGRSGQKITQKTSAKTGETKADAPIAAKRP
ncbi:MAG: hypothetical protein ACE10M_14275, partial [Alphaproteobacteria bacterium]